MTDSHPIAPPPELIEKWANNSASIHRQNGTYKQYEAAIATQAARWGADIELEACCEELEHASYTSYEWLREARRPKPPSLKEQALGLLNEGPVSDLLDHEVAIIRRALEQLPN